LAPAKPMFRSFKINRSMDPPLFFLR